MLLHAYVTALASVNAEDSCDEGGSFKVLGCEHVGDIACEVVDVVCVPTSRGMDVEVLKEYTMRDHCQSGIGQTPMGTQSFFRNNDGNTIIMKRETEAKLV